MADAWDKFKRRGEAIERYNREHLESLTLDQAIRDVEELLRNSRHFPPPDPATWPLPVSLSRLMARHGAR